MTKLELQAQLGEEVARWATLTYEDVCQRAFPVCREHGSPTDRGYYQTEVVLLERTPAYVHLAIAISDAGWRTFLPLTEDVFVYAGSPS